MVKVVDKFVGFRIIMKIQDYYIESKPDFQLKFKGVIAKEPLVIDSSNERRGGICKDLVFRAMRVQFNVFYFYMFPFVILAIPVYNLIWMVSC